MLQRMRPCSLAPLLALAHLACSDTTTAIVDASVDAVPADGSAGDAATPDGPGTADDAATPDGPGAADDAATHDGQGTIEDAGPPDAPPLSAIGCADGTREGLIDGVAFPAIAACAGTWTGDVSAGAPLCAVGWHVCLGSEAAVTAVSYAAATAFAGCFAIDAAQDSFVCRPDCSAQVAAGIDTADNLDMAGVGTGCRFQFPGAGGCLADGRIDASENSGTGCAFAAGITDGVVCCLGVVVAE